MKLILKYIADAIFVTILISQVNSARVNEILQNYYAAIQEQQTYSEYIDEMSEDFSKDKRNEILSCSISGTLNSNSNIRSVYEIDYIATNLLGLFGQPVEVDLNGAEKATLTFKVNKNNMHNVPMRNLIVLYYNEEKSCYDTVESATKGYDISVEITKSGIYLLADCYIWYSVWDADVSEYAYDAEYIDSQYNFAVVIPSEVKYYTASAPFEPIDQSDPNSGSTKEILMFRSSPSDTDLLFSFDLYKKKDGIKEALSYFNKMEPKLDAHGYGILTGAKVETIDIGGKNAYIVTYEAKGDFIQQNAVGYYEYDNDSYFVISYCVFHQNETLYEKAITSLKSFRYD